jgi:hypothetical protein
MDKKPLGLNNHLSAEVVYDISRCFSLWEQFSPKKSLFDLWDFRFAFYQAYQYQPHFILLREKNEAVGLLPLWYETERKKYLWFGGWWPEDNTFWVKKSEHLLAILDVCPSPACLTGIKSSELERIAPKEELCNFQIDDPKYVLDIGSIKSFDDYLASLKKTRRKPIKKDLALVAKQSPEVVFDGPGDFDVLVNFSRQRFAGEQDSLKDPWYDAALEDERRVLALRNVLGASGKNYTAKTVTVKINKKTAGVDLAAIYNGCYYALLGGYNLKEFPGIGNYFNMLNIKEAISLDLKQVDALQGDCSWKHRWYKEEPFYYYEK